MDANQNYVNHFFEIMLTMVHIFPWFTLFHGSHNGQAPNKQSRSRVQKKRNNLF
jgi:hypothetical protein